MAQTCPHGFSPADCLICEALGQSGSRPTATATASGRSRRRARGGPVDRTKGSVAPSEVLRRGQGRSAGTSMLAVAIGLIIAVIAVVALAGVFFALLRVVELVAVALAAGWAGYHIGHFRGSRNH